MSSRHCRSILILLVGWLCFVGAPTRSIAQDATSDGSSGRSQTGMGATQSSPPQSIDILATPPPGQKLDYRECTEKEEAAKISGEIVVCRARKDQSGDEYSSKESSLDRYAAATAFRDAPATPNPCGPNCGIFSGPATVSNLCIPGLQKCPPPPALFIDVSALPKAPPGSDADRIARGLPPLGNEDEGRARRIIAAQHKEQLDLPPAAQATAKAGEVKGEAKTVSDARRSPVGSVSPAGSAGPEAHR